MPGENIWSWSPTAGSNSNADSLIIWAEGQARASVNDSARSMMAAHAKARDLQNGSITTGGSADAQTVASGYFPAFTAVPTGMRIMVKNGFSNTASMTLNFDGIGAVVVNNLLGVPLSGGEVVAGAYCEYLYDGTNWILLERLSGSTVVVPTVTVPPTPVGGSTTVDFTTNIDDKFDIYEIIISNVVPAVDGATLMMQISTDGGATWRNTAGDYFSMVATLLTSGSGASQVYSGGSASQITLAGSLTNNGLRPLGGEIKLIAPYLAKINTIQWSLSVWTPLYLALFHGAAMYTAAVPITGVRFLMDSGNITSGNFAIHGITK